jgi:hypothetical protein
VTVPAQHRGAMHPAAGKTLAVVRAAGEGADVAGHGLLSRFHDGCRCGWCCSRAREGTCGCTLCAACRASTYVVLPRGWQA